MSPKVKISKIRESKKKAEKVKITPMDPNQALISFIRTCHENGIQYRDKFKPKWDKIESQIRVEHPPEWANKEDWQTKVFIPQQSKTSETAEAYLDKMLFGQKRFFNIKGIEKRDREMETELGTLYDTIFDRGDFSVENDFVLKEACSGPGTAFLKLTVKPDRTGINFTWRSPYNLIIDPDCGHRLKFAKYIIDEYKENIQTLIDDAKTENALYKEKEVRELLRVAEEIGQSETDEALVTVKSFDGTSVQISSKFLMVNLVEFWGLIEKKKQIKNEDGTSSEQLVYEERIVTVANNRVILRNTENDYGFKPFIAMRVKPRKYDFYALGFLDNVVDLQELTNSLINLGFDSLKLCSMDIAIIDGTKVKDPTSIEYKPMAMWMMKGDANSSVKLTRQGVSALTDITRGLTILDQYQQEATGVLRQIQGAPELGGGSETLGEFNAKLAMIDNRFLKIGRFIEKDFVEPMLKMVFRILFNSKFFSQLLIDRILGTKTEIIGANPDGSPITQEVSKLSFDVLAQIGEMGLDFKAVGMTQFVKTLETLQKLKELLGIILQTPQLQVLFKIDEIVKRVLQAAEIQDYQDLMKTKEEIEAVMNKIYSGVQSGGTPPPQGAGAPPGRLPGPAPSGGGI